MIRLRVPGTLAYRDLAVRVVAAACKLVGQGDHSDFDHQVISAFGEAYNNAAIHAYRGRSGELELRIQISADHITVELRDDGAAFDPAAVPPPDLSALPESGLGLYIMSSFMDEVSYRPGAPNILSMTKYLDRSSKSIAGD